MEYGQMNASVAGGQLAKASATNAPAAAQALVVAAGIDAETTGKVFAEAAKVSPETMGLTLVVAAGINAETTGEALAEAAKALCIGPEATGLILVVAARSCSRPWSALSRSSRHGRRLPTG